MDIISSVMGYVSPEFPAQGIRDLEKTGYKEIMLDMALYCSGGVIRQYEKKFKPEQMRADYERFIAQLQTSTLKVTAAVLPALPADTKRTDVNGLVQQVAKDCIASLEKIQCGTIIVRPLSIGVPECDSWTVNRQYYLELAEVCRNAETQILLQNDCRNVSGHLVRGICSDVSEAARWVDELNKTVGTNRFGFCMDTGNYNLCGQNMQDVAVTLGDRVKAVLLRDNDGVHKQNQMPFVTSIGMQQNTDWLSLFRGLREIGFDGQLIASFEDTLEVFPPLLRPPVYALTKSVAEYFRWQIEMETSLNKYQSIVLFGAGNMCRNFMKCYGTRYKPLFTCDNNSKMWGTEFEGLEVKSPEALCNLPDDCGVYICNMYYREIEKQLRDMGVQNIEFFNDEYMPSFYVDRIGRQRED